MSTAIAAVCRTVPYARRWQTVAISDDTELRAAWTATVGDAPAELAALDDVVGRHREPHRRYHNLRHVTWVVRHVGELAGEVPLADLGAVTVAAFFHDAVYAPRAGDNEERSAQLAERVLEELGWDADRRRMVGRHVRATTSHATPPADEGGGNDTAVLLDADLAILGAEPAAYQAYVTGVRAEYAHVDDDAWRSGRGAVLRDLLAREHLYATEAGRRRWATRAAANITSELATL
jgi:predicted metal-dependent HD superfamily phosphohydrolase